MTSIIKNDLLKIALYFLLTVCGGAILSPALFYAGKAIAGTGVLHESAFQVLRELGRILEETNFQRYFNRAVLLSAVVCLVPLVKSLNLFNRGAFALEKNPSRWVHLAGGFSLAAGLLLVMGWMFVLSGVFGTRPPEDRESLLIIFRGAMLSAIVVGLLEEFFFRGMLLGVCIRASSKNVALYFVTALFAAVHFLKPPEHLHILDAEVTWETGFMMVGQCFWRFSDPMPMVSEFTTLCAVGWILGVARLRTNSLWVSIGLHAGWVFGLKTFGALTVRVRSLDETLPWVGHDLKNGVISLLVVALTGWLVHLWLRETQAGRLGG